MGQVTLCGLSYPYPVSPRILVPKSRVRDSHRIVDCASKIVKRLDLDLAEDMFDYFKAFSLLAAAMHVGFFYLETVIWGTPKANKIMKLKAADATTMALFARNQGFYNLFLALGIFHAWFGGGDESVVVFCCACMLGAAVVLVGLSNGKMLSSGLMQGMPPAIALAAHHLL